jgi:hypothetical protein
MMPQPSRRTPLKSGRRRMPLTITVDSKTNEGLQWIGNGNRSRAIEVLVKEHLLKFPQQDLPARLRTVSAPA